MFKRRFLYIVLALSLTFNGLVIWYDVWPTILPKVQKRYFPAPTMASLQISQNDLEQRVYEAGKDMFFEKQAVTVWHEPRGFTDAMLKLRSVTASKEFQIDNYPRAFLFKGLFDYSKNKHNDLSEFEKYFDEEILGSHYQIKRIDQVPIGEIALELFESTGEIKYIKFASRIYNYILSLVDEDGVLSYRSGQNVLYYDALGLTIPFLVEYGRLGDEDRAIEIAQLNLTYYVSYGLSANEYIPSHGINKITKTPIGSSNWGRGIGWYLLGLSTYHSVTGEFRKEYEGLVESLYDLKNEHGLWGQFPGSKDKFDASTTLLLVYSELLNNPRAYKKSEFLDALSRYIKVEGQVLETSGDTYSANYYSSTFGMSELSQGLLLSIISRLED